MTENNLRRKPACPYSDSNENLQARAYEILEAGQRVYNTTTGMTIIGDGKTSIGNLTPFKEGLSGGGSDIDNNYIINMEISWGDNEFIIKTVNDNYSDLEEAYNAGKNLIVRAYFAEAEICFNALLKQEEYGFIFIFDYGNLKVTLICSSDSWQIYTSNIVDSELSSTSINPVQNKVITKELNNKQDKLTFDNEPKLGSSNPVTSESIKMYVDSQNLLYEGIMDKKKVDKEEFWGMSFISSYDDFCELVVKDSYTSKETGLMLYNQSQTDTAIANAIGDVETALERIKNYGDVNIEPSPLEWFSFSENESYVSLMGLSDEWAVLSEVANKSHIVIPYEFNGKPVIKINAGAFDSNTEIESIVIPNSVTDLGEEAFMRCEDLKLVTLSDGISVIKEFTFACCNNLEKVSIPYGVGIIADNAFLFNGINPISRCVVIPDTVQLIADNAFADSHSVLTLAIICNPGSYAEEYAGRNNIQYKYIPNDGNTETTENKVTEISMTSSHKEYPSARAVYNLNTATELRIEEAYAKASEAYFIAREANQALSYPTYAHMCDEVKSLPADILRVGQNIYIVTRNIPDLWVSGISDTTDGHEEYSSDEAWVESLLTKGTIQVGHYILSPLETQIEVSGGSIEVDDELSADSENPVQNKVVTENLNNKIDKTAIYFDDSGNLVVTIGGVSKKFAPIES